MRVLFSSTAGAGHFGPLVPFIVSCLKEGHEAMVAAPDALAASAAATGADFWPFDGPPQQEMGAAFEKLNRLSHDEANAWVVSEIFGRLDSTAALPRLSEAIATWRPDFVVRESAEFGSAVAAELHGVPQARVGIGLGAMEEYILNGVAASVDGLRRANGLPPDPGASRLRETVYLTLFPAGLEDPAIANPSRTVRFRDPAWDAFSTPVRTARPFVYVTFGSVAAGLPHVAAVYAEALDAVADLDADVLLTVGRDTDPATLPTTPPNVHIDRWVDQADVLGRASAVVCHGGGGSTLGALAAGAPLVIVPLFTEDQHLNARRVAAVGAGITATSDAASIRSALDVVLTEPSHRAAAEDVAAELAHHPSTDEAPVTLLAGPGPR